MQKYGFSNLFEPGVFKTNYNAEKKVINIIKYVPNAFVYNKIELVIRKRIQIYIMVSLFNFFKCKYKLKSG